MASIYSTLGRLEIMTKGEKDAAWGDVTSANLQLLEQMIHGYESIDLSLGPTLSLTTVNGTADQGRKKILKFTGAAALVTVIVPSITHEYLIWNAGNFDIVVKTILGSGPTIAANTKTIVFCDGSAVQTLSGLSTTPFTISLLDDPDAPTARGTLSVPGLTDSKTRNIFTDPNPVEFRLNDSGSSAGPSIVGARDSGTPAANDFGAIYRWYMRDSNAVMQQFASLFAKLVSPTPGSHSGLLGINTPIAGSFADRFFFGAGFFTATAAGGDKGTDTINAKVYHIDGVPISTVLGYLDYRDEKAQNTDGGTFTAGAWQRRDLNVEAWDTGGFGSLSSSQITLAAGTYEVMIRTPAFGCGGHQCRLQNISDATTTVLGQTAAASGANITSVSVAIGRFVIGSTKIFEVQHRCASTRTTDGFGPAANFGTELYTIAKFWKIA